MCRLILHPLKPAVKLSPTSKQNIQPLAASLLGFLLIPLGLFTGGRDQKSYMISNEMWKTSGGTSMKAREENLVKQTDWWMWNGTVCITAPDFFRHFWHWLWNQSDSEVGNGEPQTTQPLPQGTWVAKNSCTIEEWGRGSFPEPPRNFWPIF